MSDFRCGYVALIGRPNAGKSTLLNRVLGEKLAITSAKPQTTRNRIVGMHSTEQMQLILVDTPGIHRAWTELNKQMVSVSIDSMSEVDVVCWVCDMTQLGRRAQRGEPLLDRNEQEIADALKAAGRPVIFVPNKVDVTPKELLLPVIEAWHANVELAASVPISALTGDGVDMLLEKIREMLPVHPPLFPVDVWTEVPEKFLVAEIIREKIFHLTEREVPYSVAIEIRSFDEEKRESDSLVRIFADVIVERPSQKGILIGKGGEMLKRIGTLARKEIQEVLGCRLYLKLFVKVEKNWTRSERGLRRVGFKADGVSRPSVSLDVESFIVSEE